MTSFLQLALALGIPMYAADPDFFDFGTKSGGRKLFAAEGVPHPLGVERDHGAGRHLLFRGPSRGPAAEDGACP